MNNAHALAGDPYVAAFPENLPFWEATARNIVKVANRDKIVVEKSTLPVRTAEAMERIKPRSARS